jgi:hypothetical protein
VIGLGFVLSNSFVQKVRRLSPFKPINVGSTWFDDDRGEIADIVVRHKHRVHGLLSIMVHVDKKSTNKSVLTEIRRKMLHWHKVR